MGTGESVSAFVSVLGWILSKYPVHVADFITNPSISSFYQQEINSKIDAEHLLHLNLFGRI